MCDRGSAANLARAMTWQQQTSVMAGQCGILRADLGFRATVRSGPVCDWVYSTLLSDGTLRQTCMHEKSLSLAVNR